MMNLGTPISETWICNSGHGKKWKKFIGLEKKQKHMWRIWKELEREFDSKLAMMEIENTIQHSWVQYSLKDEGRDTKE